MARLDYLRLASFDFNYSKMIASFMYDWAGDWQPSRWLQYKGWSCEGVFVGVGEQSKSRHMIISASGSESVGLSAWMLKYRSFYCTRMDLQRTIIKPKHAQLRRIRQRTNTANTTLIESRENDTLYIGSRTSDLFTRLYEKDLDVMYLRLEFELKGSRSRAAWAGMMHGRTPSEIYSYYLKKSSLPCKVKSWFRELDDSNAFKADREIVLQTAKKKLKWLRSLDESIEKAMANHEIGEQVKTLVRSWAAAASTLDENGKDL